MVMGPQNMDAPSTLMKEEAESFTQNNTPITVTAKQHATIADHENASDQQETPNAAARSRGEASTSSSLNNFPARSAAGTMQAWDLTRPVLDHCPILTRRQLRRLNKAWTLEEVSRCHLSSSCHYAVAFENLR